MPDSGVGKKRPLDSPSDGVSGVANGVGASDISPNSNTYSDVIDNLMEIEARVNQEMTLRYRNSVIGSSIGVDYKNGRENFEQQTFGSSSLDNSSDGGGGPSSSSAFSQPVRPCTVDDLNEVCILDNHFKFCENVLQSPVF